MSDIGPQHTEGTCVSGHRSGAVIQTKAYENPALNRID
jgi:hypothetical protein